MRVLAAVLVVAVVTVALPARAEESLQDRRVRDFLEAHAGRWHDWNVPVEDGRILHDLVEKHRFRRALEIGTSTGHSAIWIAWALAKNGGGLVTIEIDRSRHQTAVRNLREAGLDAIVDARLGDAHQLVRQLRGPFDFVFSDADKGWYLQYFKDVEPKLEVGGCFTAHNVLGGGRGIREFLDHVRALPNYRTTIERGGGAGLSVSCKLSR